MKIEFFVEGKTVYERSIYRDGTTQIIKIRECNTEQEAQAVANYYRVRRE